MRNVMGNGVYTLLASLYRSNDHGSKSICSPVCDSYVRPETLVRICDECNFGTYGGRCIICGSPGM